jgi:hypothetical protein
MRKPAYHPGTIYRPMGGATPLTFSTKTERSYRIRIPLEFACKEGYGAYFVIGPWEGKSDSVSTRSGKRWDDSHFPFAMLTPQDTKREDALSLASHLAEARSSGERSERPGSIIFLSRTKSIDGHSAPSEETTSLIARLLSELMHIQRLH